MILNLVIRIYKFVNIWAAVTLRPIDITQIFGISVRFGIYKPGDILPAEGLTAGSDRLQNPLLPRNIHRKVA